MLVIDYGPRSVLLNVGNPASSEPKTLEELESEHIKSLNQLSAAFKRCLRAYGVEGYISLSEERGNWAESNRYTPISVHSADLLTLDELDN